MWKSNSWSRGCLWGCCVWEWRWEVVFRLKIKEFSRALLFWANYSIWQVQFLRLSEFSEDQGHTFLYFLRHFYQSSGGPLFSDLFFAIKAFSNSRRALGFKINLFLLKIDIRCYFLKIFKKDQNPFFIKDQAPRSHF